MKKLMIAAAAVAMIGAAEAKDAQKQTLAIYDFSAYLTTTTSAETETEAQTTQKPYHLWAASDGNDKYWYDDDAVKTLLKDGEWAWKNPETYPELKWSVYGAGTAFEHPVLTLTTGVLDENSASFAFLTNGFWATYQVTTEVCLELDWITQKTVGPQPVCYRVQSGENIMWELGLTTNCCDATAQFVSVYSKDARGTDWYFGAVNQGIMWNFMNRFGAPLAKDAMMVELYGSSQFVTTSHKEWDEIAQKEAERGLRPFDGWLAGQGWCQVLNVGGENRILPVSISGNIVGQLDPTTCGCCVANLPRALAFYCMTDGDASLAQTAGYGWFYLQYAGERECIDDRQ